jgi:hypothetical protein
MCSSQVSSSYTTSSTFCTQLDMWLAPQIKNSLKSVLTTFPVFLRHQSLPGTLMPSEPRSGGSLGSQHSMQLWLLHSLREAMLQQLL